MLILRFSDHGRRSAGTSGRAQPAANAALGQVRHPVIHDLMGMGWAPVDTDPASLASLGINLADKRVDHYAGRLGMGL